MSFKVGDRVVYPHHGAAEIVRLEKRTTFGEEQDYLVLRMTHGEMTVAVPADKAEVVGMRWPISTEDVDDLFDVLARKDVREPANWSRRYKNHQEKLKSGDVYQVAEVRTQPGAARPGQGAVRRREDALQHSPKRAGVGACRSRWT